MIIQGISLGNGIVRDLPGIVTANLVANYDPATGLSGSNFTDSSGNGYTATIYGSPSTPVIHGRTVLQLLSASSQWYSYTSGYSSSLVGGAVTFDVWFNSFTASTSQILIGEFGQAGYSGGWNDAVMALNTSYKIAGGVYNGSAGGYVAAPTTYAANTWYNAVVTYTPSTISLYVNGVSQGTLNTTRATPPSPLYYAIGYPTTATQYLGGSSGYFNGYMGAVKIYSQALTQAQVTQNFNAMRGNYGV